MFTIEVETIVTRNMNTEIKFCLHKMAVGSNIMAEVTETRL